MTLNRVLIQNGPNKFDLMVSLFEGNKPPRKTVQFSVSSEQDEAGVTVDVEVAITLIAQADSSGEAWVFEGYTRHAITKEQVGVVRGYYSSKLRKGWYQFADKTVPMMYASYGHPGEGG